MIGILVAALVLIIIAIILVILVNPITYSFEVVGRSPYVVDFRILWCGRICRIHFRYEQGKPFFKEVYLAFKPLVGETRDYQDWLSRRVEEETAQLEDKPDINSYAEALQEMQDRPKVDPIQGEGPAVTACLTPDGHFDFGSIVVNAREKIEDVKEKIEGAKETFEQKKQEFDEKKEKVQEGIEFMRTVDWEKGWWKKHLMNPDLYSAGLTFMGKVIDHSKPGKVEIEGSFGIGDPYKMGLITASAYMALGEHLDRVNFDFVDCCAEGSMYVRGRVYLGVLAWLGLCFAIKKPVRLLLIDVGKASVALFKHYRSYKAAKAC